MDTKTVLNKEVLTTNTALTNRFCFLESTKFETVKGSGKLLCLANGYFAGDAYEKNDGSLESISGEAFGIIAGDDNCSYKERKFNISRPTIDEILEHIGSCSDDFGERIERFLNR